MQRQTGSSSLALVFAFALGPKEPATTIRYTTLMLNHKGVNKGGPTPFPLHTHTHTHKESPLKVANSTKVRFPADTNWRRPIWALDDHGLPGKGQQKQEVPPVLLLPSPPSLVLMLPLKCARLHFIQSLSGRQRGGISQRVESRKLSKWNVTFKLIAHEKVSLWQPKHEVRTDLCMYWKVRR